MIQKNMVTSGTLLKAVRGLADGCAAFSEEVHAATIASLASVVEIGDCAGVIAALAPR